MKAILEFNLDELDDRMAHERCVAAEKLANVIWEFLYNTRKEIEFTLDDPKKDLTTYEAVDLVYNKFISILDEEGVVIDKLII